MPRLAGESLSGRRGGLLKIAMNTVFVIGLLVGAAIASLVVICLFVWARRAGSSDQKFYNDRTLELLAERNEIDRQSMQQLQQIASELNIRNQR